MGVGFQHIVFGRIRTFGLWQYLFETSTSNANNTFLYPLPPLLLAKQDTGWAVGEEGLTCVLQTSRSTPEHGSMLASFQLFTCASRERGQVNSTTYQQGPKGTFSHVLVKQH